MFEACKNSVISKMHITLFFPFYTVDDVNVKMSEGTFCRVEVHIISLWKLVNKISQEPLKPGSLYLDHRLCLRCR